MFKYPILIYILILFILFPSKSFAYLDPGTGSILLQALIGFIASLFTSFYIFWNKIKLIFKKIYSKLLKKKQ
jgi:hypothetical protein